MVVSIVFNFYLFDFNFYIFAVDKFILANILLKLDFIDYFLLIGIIFILSIL